MAIYIDGVLQEITISNKSQILISGPNISWDLNKGNYGTVILEENGTINNPEGIVDGQLYFLVVTQDSTGGWTLAFGTAYRFPGDIAPTIFSDANKSTLFSGIGIVNENGSYISMTKVPNFDLDTAV